MKIKRTVDVRGHEYKTKDLTIEPAYSKYGNPNPGEDEWALYYHFTHPRSSVLRGQRGRQYLEAGTREELEEKFVGVEVRGGSSYIDPDQTVPSGKPSDYEEPWDEE